MKTLLLSICLLLFFAFISTAQNVGINTTGAAPDNSAILDLNATDKGFLITRADTANIASPAFGLMTLAPSDSCLYMFSGTAWIGMGGGGSNCSCNSSPPNTGGSSFTCGSSLTDTRDNKTYGTVQIGNQCWMSQNLNYTPSSGYFWCYNNDVTYCNIYGILYDWNTATNTTASSANPSGVQGVCPVGWHIPSDAEWKELEMHLGMSSTEANSIGWRGTNEGSALKATSWGGNNSSGFSALPGGLGHTNSSMFINEGINGYWLTTTEESSIEMWQRTLNDGIGTIHRSAIHKGSSFLVEGQGLSVRCVRD